MTDQAIDAVELAAELTAAWLSNSNTRTNPDDVPAFLRSMHQAIVSLAGGAAADAAPEQEYVGAVTARKSTASRDYIVSMIDGKPYRTLRRHLSTHGLTPEQYRERYNLKTDYPMVAPSYSEARRAMANKIGLGRKKGESALANAGKPGAKLKASRGVQDGPKPRG